LKWASLCSHLYGSSFKVLGIARYNEKTLVSTTAT
jgi:hypothetical protein